MEKKCLTSQLNEVNQFIQSEGGMLDIVTG